MKFILSIIISFFFFACADAQEGPKGDSKPALKSDIKPVSKPASSVFSLVASEWSGPIKGQYIQFGEDGIARGNGGCNQFYADYRQNDDRLFIAILETTEKTCDVIAQEKTFFSILFKTAYMDATQFELLLKDKKGKQILRLTRRDWD